MHDTITFCHGLASFDVTADPITVCTKTNKKQALPVGPLQRSFPRYAPAYGKENNSSDTKEDS